MQSSGGLVIRALLLLGCLLALPVLAIWGSSLPEAVQTALAGRVPGVEPAAAKPDGEPPRFVPTPATEASRAAPAPPSSAPDPQARIEQRLQQLGANYYRLEEWGDRRECFRFVCEMPLDSGPQPARTFQAIRDDRLEAMAEVLRQVEAYRGG